MSDRGADELLSTQAVDPSSNLSLMSSGYNTAASSEKSRWSHAEVRQICILTLSARTVWYSLYKPTLLGLLMCVVCYVWVCVATRWPKIKLTGCLYKVCICSPGLDWQWSRDWPHNTWVYQICSDINTSALDALHEAQDRSTWQTVAFGLRAMISMLMVMMMSTWCRLAQAMYEDWGWGNPAEGTSEEDLVGMCQRDMESFWPVLWG